MGLPQVHTIIVNHNGLAYNSTCIHSLMAQQGVKLDIIVVDNASTDGSLQALRDEYKGGLTYIALTENTFFAAGANVGMEKALANSAEYIFLLNNDTIVEPDCLWQLLYELQQFSNLAAVQPLLVSMATPHLIASAGCEVSRTGFCWDKDAGKRINDINQAPHPIAAISGGAALWKADCLQNIGLFDPDFGMYYEDVDLSFRARKAKLDLCIVPRARVRHIGGASAKQQSTSFCASFCHINALRLIMKHWPKGWRLDSIFFWFVVSFMILLKTLFKRDWGMCRAVSKSTGQGIVYLLDSFGTFKKTEINENDILKLWIARNYIYPGKKIF